MLNKAILIGRLVRDVDLRYTPNSVAVATFTLAVDRNYTNQQGEREADFIPIVTWRDLAENCGKYLSKGRLVAVSGRIQVRSYEAKDGTKRYITEIIASEIQFLDKAKDGQAQEPSGFIPPVDEDDTLPF